MKFKHIIKDVLMESAQLDWRSFQDKTGSFTLSDGTVVEYKIKYLDMYFEVILHFILSGEVFTLTHLREFETSFREMVRSLGFAKTREFSYFEVYYTDIRLTYGGVKFGLSNVLVSLRKPYIRIEGKFFLLNNNVHKFDDIPEEIVRFNPNIKTDADRIRKKMELMLKVYGKGVLSDGTKYEFGDYDMSVRDLDGSSDNDMISSVVSGIFLIYVGKEWMNIKELVEKLRPIYRKAGLEFKSTIKVGKEPVKFIENEIQ